MRGLGVVVIGLRMGSMLKLAACCACGASNVKNSNAVSEQIDVLNHSLRW